MNDLIQFSNICKTLQAISFMMFYCILYR